MFTKAVSVFFVVTVCFVSIQGLPIDCEDSIPIDSFPCGLPSCFPTVYKPCHTRPLVLVVSPPSPSTPVIPLPPVPEPEPVLPEPQPEPKICHCNLKNVCAPSACYNPEIEIKPKVIVRPKFIAEKFVVEGPCGNVCKPGTTGCTCGCE